MMLCKTWLIGVSALMTSHVLAVRARSPLATDLASDNYDSVGFSPVPTTAPPPHALKARYNRLLQPRAQLPIGTCGYIDGSQNDPYSCSSGSACSLNAASRYFGCCSADTKGNFYTSACPSVAKPYTSCYPSKQASNCAGTCTNHNLICDSATPYCATAYLTSGTAIYTQNFCTKVSEGATMKIYTTFTDVLTGATTRTTSTSTSTSLPDLPDTPEKSSLSNQLTTESNKITASAKATTSLKAVSSLKPVPSSEPNVPGEEATEATESKAAKPVSRVAIYAGGIIGGLVAAGAVAGATVVGLKKRKAKQSQTEHAYTEASQVEK